MISRESARWAHSLGAKHAHQPQPHKLCVFRLGSEHARYWILGWRGQPFEFGRAAT